MQKKTYLRTLNDLAKHFSEDEEALWAISILQKKCDELPDEHEKKVISNHFPIPPDIDFQEGSVALFSDGGCRGNPGPGAWGFCAQIKDGELLTSDSGFEEETTNNRMELLGAINALRFLDEYCLNKNISVNNVHYLFSDSRYVLDGLSSWIEGWKRKGWRKSDNKPPENLDLWMELDELANYFPKLKYIWVKGHSGHPQNEHCDQLANTALDANVF